MNKERRQELLEVVDLLQEAKDRLDEIVDDEQDSFDSLPDSLQDSITGLKMQEALETMEVFGEAIMSLQNQIEQYANPKKKKK